MIAMIVLFIIGLEDLKPNIFSTSPILIPGSTKALSQCSILFHILAASGHSINSCIMVSDGALQYTQVASAINFISNIFLLVAMHECSSLNKMYLVYALIGSFLMCCKAISI